jgi:glyoxylase-like metal-dependent hydrolase (beta-lactamase superfamily II)
MNLRVIGVLALFGGALLSCRSASDPAFEAPGTPPAASIAGATEVARGVYLLPGRFVSGTQPDGNSIVFTAPEGLVVVDTGRHAEHTQRILDFAAGTNRPIRAVVNTHWHLDHIGGNPKVKKAFPESRVFATGAVREALTGFLANYRSQLETMIGELAGKEEQQKPLRAEMAIIDSGAALFPDETLTSTGDREIAGKRLLVGVERHAVTAGDVWIFDRKSGVLAAGDLITLPAPFFDTACAAQWKTSLDNLVATDFRTVVPGHGRVLGRGDVLAYRFAFGRLLECGASARPKSECIDGWISDARTLIAERDEQLARGLIDYYVDNHLRGDPARNAKLCGG